MHSPSAMVCDLGMFSSVSGALFPSRGFLVVPVAAVELWKLYLARSGTIEICKPRKPAGVEEAAHGFASRQRYDIRLVSHRFSAFIVQLDLNPMHPLGCTGRDEWRLDMSGLLICQRPHLLVADYQ